MTTINQINEADNWDFDFICCGANLQSLMEFHKTDKLAHGYMSEYAWHFSRIRDNPIRLLEIGIGGYGVPNSGGESLKVWRDYFQQGLIVGLDVEDKSHLNEERIKTWRASQNNVGQLAELNKTHGPFDIVIDDGSHEQSDIMASFRILFPAMNAGGIYVIEDLATSYQSEHGGDPLVHTADVIGLVGRLIDGIHWQFWKERTPRAIDKMVKSVHISKELVFIYKQ